MTVPEPALGEKCLIQGIEVGGGELLKRDRAKRRKHAGADVRAVVREGRRPEIAQARQPLTDEEALEGLERSRPATTATAPWSMTGGRPMRPGNNQ